MTNKRLQKFTSADILACIKFENNDDDDSKRKKKNRRVRFSTGMSISVDSLVQCNSDHQADSKEDGEKNESANIANRQFLEKEFVNVSPHMHLATGENKIYSAYLEDTKTVGYGRRCLNLYPRYNNSFDPRLSFCGLLGEMNVKAPVTAFGDSKHTDTFNCALTLHDPAGFTNSYLNTYRIYLKRLDTAVCVPRKQDTEAEESESSINLNEAEGITEEEIRLREKLETVKYLWPSDQKFVSPSKVAKETRPEMSADCGGISYSKERTVGVISEPLCRLSSCYNVDTSSLKAAEKFIVHTTCLKSDGQSTETRIHKTILKNTAAAVKNGGQETLKDMALQQLIRDGSPKISGTDMKYAYNNKAAKSNENSPEDYEDDSDATLTPGEEDSETRSMRSPGTDRDLKGLNTEPRRQTKLRATTEPFIPTNQRQQAQINVNQNLAPNPANVETIGNNETIAKQTTAATSNEAIYQTSNMFQRLDPHTVTADVTKQPPLLWYSYQAPPVVDNHQVQQQSHHHAEINQTHQEFQQQRYQLQPHIHNQQTPRPHDIPEPQLHPQPQPHFSRRENSANHPVSLPQDHKTQHFNPRVHSQYHYHHHHHHQHQQKIGQGHHIPVHTSTRNPGGSHKHHRGFPQNHPGGPQTHGGNHYRHQTSNLQGQPSNQQPVYNSFWLQFQNNASNVNLPYGVPVNQPRQNIVPNYIPSGPNIRQDVPQRYDFVPQTDTVKHPVAHDLTSHTAIPTRDGQFVRMQNSYALMNQQFMQDITERQEVNAVGTCFPRSETHRTQAMPVEPHASRISDANSNNNANAFEEDLNSFEEAQEETEGCIIDVLESSRSREKYRALKKSFKKLRPIRSCLVQVV